MPLMTLLFSFRGRINRAKYWYTLLGCMVFLAIHLLVAIVGIGVSSAMHSDGPFINYLMIGTGGILWLAVIWSSVATGVKRLHDRDQSGWWMLVFFGVSTGVSLLQESAATPSSTILLGVASFAVTVWIVVELGCLRGTAGPNTYGPDPLDTYAASPQR